MGKTYTSTIEVRCLKEHTCLCCGAVYAYELRRKVTGSSSNKEKAIVNARAAAARSVQRDVDPEPCPTCGLLQPDMIGQRRAKKHKAAFWIALIAFIVVIILKISYAIQADMAIWIGVAACALFALWHLAIDLPDSNRNLEANKQKAEERVASGTIRHQPGQFDPGALIVAKPARSMGHKLALFLLLGAVALSTEPEAMRMARGWPLNADCYPPVIGPGDHSRIYMNDKISSIKGYWRGTPIVILQQSGATKRITASAETNESKWDSSISVKSSEKDNTSTPWVNVHIPDDPALAQKTVNCNIDLSVVYPKISGSSTFQPTAQQIQRNLDLKLATPGAGTSYDNLWWTGTVLAMGIILFSGLCLLFAARGLERKANPTRTFVPDDSAPA